MAKKQPSRKGSKAWRKNVDVKDIQDGIDEKATREILGLDDPKTDLFVIDTLGSESLQKEAKKLKIDQEFELKSKVGAVVQKQRKNTTKPVFIGFKTRNVSINNLNQILKGAKKMKMEGVQIGDHLKKRKQAKQERIADAKKSRGGYDIWGDTATTTTPVSKRPRKGLDLQSTILPGFSYQPTEMDHQDLLRIATDVELKTIESISKVEESLSYPPELDLLSGDNTFVEDDEETDTEPIEINPKFVVKPTKPKSKVDLNRKKRAAQKMLEEKQLSQQKKIAKDINKY